MTDGPSVSQSAAAFADLWRAFGAPKNLLLAVSGGSDSIALLRLAANLRCEGAAVHVATVDHGLRAASADDAAFVLRASGALGIPAMILRWEGEKPSSGLQAAARGARYRLLAQASARLQADAILTAHTADDQAETVLMRMAHRSGPRGLAGMAREIFIADGAGMPQRLLRPLLGWRRADLRSILSAERAAFVDDTSNSDRRFERVRARSALASAGEPVIVALLAAAAEARALSRVLDRLEHVRLASLRADFQADGSVRLSSSDASRSVDASLIARLLAAVGGGEVPADAAAGAALDAALAGRRATLAGAIIGRKGRDLMIMREPAAVLGRKDLEPVAPVRLAAGEKVLWDRRFSVENTLSGDAEIRPLGAVAQALNPFLAETLSTAPGLWRGGELAAFPGDDGVGEGAIVSLAPERFYRRVIRH
ncbi:MAG: tRNA lysidine(34) synthetase TilS [Parvularculaceae bacterium]|nr:tRNA lysidine(34) synthetase TilS [Parvularculaceae bacterium]